MTVTPAYFRVMGIPLKRGRAFEERDDSHSPNVAIINEAMAALHWPGEDPMGKRISRDGPEGPWTEIVGVVGDTRLASADLPPTPIQYIPHAQKPWRWLTWLTIVVRPNARLGHEALAPSIRAAVWELDPLLPVQRVTTAEELYRESTSRRRFAMTLLAGFAAMSLLLGTVGLYGVLSYTVAQRRQHSPRGLPRGGRRKLIR